MNDITNYTSFKVPSKAKQLSIINEIEDIKNCNLKEIDEFVVLGEGSNVLFIGDYNGYLLVNKIDSLHINELDDCAYITAGAGINWHQFICQMSESGFYGLENLAYIPGTVGACPVQNIGAYGVEVESFIDEVIVFDLRTQAVAKFKHNECNFSYRNSNFKNPSWRKRYIIISVVFKLPKQFSPVISYKELQQSFEGREFTANDLLKKVVEIRQEKLPNHHEVYNAGSFFKNPIVPRSKLDLILNRYPDVPYYNQANNEVKISAAWLIEKLGFKGAILDNGAGVYDMHALILINSGGALGLDIYNLANSIITKVLEEFSLKLEPEVRYIGSNAEQI